MMTDMFLTIGEVAELFRTTPQGIYQRIHRTKNGRDTFPMPVNGLGKRHLWLRDELFKHIQNCATSSTAQMARTRPENVAKLARHGIKKIDQ